jgi:hypothetical protein
MEVTPQITETPTGEQITGFTVSEGMPGGTWTPSHDFVEDSQGNFNHMFSDVELEEPGHTDPDQMMTDAVFELFPNYESMLGWAMQTYPQEVLDSFDAHVEANDWDQVMPFIEQMAAQYSAAGGQIESPEVEDATEDDDGDPEAYVENWFEQIADEEIDEAVDGLYDMDFSEDSAGAFLDVIHDYEAGSCAHAILSAGISLSNGSLDIETAIDAITSEYGDALAYATYLELEDTLNV